MIKKKVIVDDEHKKLRDMFESLHNADYTGMKAIQENYKYECIGFKKKTKSISYSMPYL